MRAVVLEKFGAYAEGRVRDVPRPEPGPGEIVIAVEAAPVNYVDLVVAAGKYQFPPPLPYTPGKGPSGRVSALGPDVGNLEIGDRVLGMAETGGYAEFVRVAARDCYRLPDALSFPQAAAMSLAYDTAWFALRDRARVTAGDHVLVLGATGAVGRAAVSLARALGAHPIAAVSSLSRGAAAARSSGAEAIVDLSVADLRDSLRDQVFAATGGTGVDVVIDMLGGDVFDAALRAVAWRGRVVVVGFAAGRIPTVKVNYLMLKNIEISGLQVSDYRKKRPDMTAACYREIFSLYARGSLPELPVRTLPLEEFAAAMQAVEMRATSHRLVLEPGTPARDLGGGGPSGR